MRCGRQVHELNGSKHYDFCEKDVTHTDDHLARCVETEQYVVWSNKKLEARRIDAAKKDPVLLKAE